MTNSDNTVESGSGTPAQRLRYYARSLKGGTPKSLVIKAMQILADELDAQPELDPCTVRTVVYNPGVLTVTVDVGRMSDNFAAGDEVVVTLKRKAAEPLWRVVRKSNFDDEMVDQEWASEPLPKEDANTKACELNKGIDAMSKYFHDIRPETYTLYKFEP